MLKPRKELGVKSGKALLREKRQTLLSYAPETGQPKDQDLIRKLKNALFSTYYYTNSNNNCSNNRLELNKLQDSSSKRRLKIKRGGKDKPSTEFEAGNAYSCNRH